MKSFFVGFGVLLLLLSGLSQIASTDETIGKFGCDVKCPKKPNNVAQFIGCSFAIAEAAAKAEGKDLLQDIITCSGYNSDETCGGEGNTPTCWWIVLPEAFSSTLGAAICVPRSLAADKDSINSKLTSAASMFGETKFPAYANIILCLQQSGKDACATTEDSSQTNCASCGAIPEHHFPARPSLCLPGEIATDACTMILAEPVTDCPSAEEKVDSSEESVDTAEEDMTAEPGNTMTPDAATAMPNSPGYGPNNRLTGSANFPGLDAVGCSIGCTRKVKTLSQLAVCGLGAGLMGDGLAPVFYCGKYTTMATCETASNNPQCVWIELRKKGSTKLQDFKACLPKKVVPDKAMLTKELPQFLQYLPPDFPPHNEIVECLEVSGDTRPRTCTRRRGGGKLCVLCSGLPVTASAPFNPPLTQLCLHPSIDWVCDQLKATSVLEICPARSDSISHSGVALISLITSLLILLMS